MFCATSKERNAHLFFFFFTGRAVEFVDKGKTFSQIFRTYFPKYNLSPCLRRFMLQQGEKKFV
jgi:hypothetical protein